MWRGKESSVHTHLQMDINKHPFSVTQRGLWRSKLEWSKNRLSPIWPMVIPLVLSITFFHLCLLHTHWINYCILPVYHSFFVHLHSNFMLFRLPVRLPLSLSPCQHVNLSNLSSVLVNLTSSMEHCLSHSIIVPVSYSTERFVCFL